jgi:hypothetical protein
MKKVTIFAILVIVTIGWSIYPTEGFIPTQFFARGSKLIHFFTRRQFKSVVTHRDMTRNAILEVAAEVLRDNPNPSDRQGSSQRLTALTSLNEGSLITAYYGSSDNTRSRKEELKYAVEAMQKATAGVDAGEEQHLAAAHFDSEQFESGQDRLIALRQSVVSSIKVGDYDAARRDTGRMFHTLQDFYSHTNWIENGNRAPNPVLGQPDQRIENTASSTEETCTDCIRRGLPGTPAKGHYYECRDNIKRSLIDNGILTSGYGAVQTDYNGKVTEKQPGKCSHGGLFVDSKQDTPARGGINKDSPYNVISPHFYLHSEAVAVAQQATTDMLRNMRRDMNNDQLFGTYLGVFQNRASSRVYTSRGSWNRNAMLQHHWNRIEGKAACLQ